MFDTKFPRSQELHKKASRILPGGVSSNARLWYDICPIYGPCTIFVDRASGSHLWDVDGNEYVDYRLGFGPVILGHGNQAVRRRIGKSLKKGTIYAFDNELEIKVAEKIQSLVPSAEMIRFSVSGTEAVMHALRIARGYTGKKKILKFEGHYHGGSDYMLYSTTAAISDLPPRPVPASLGIPDEVQELTLVNQWNDFGETERTVREHANDLAAIITEPVMGNAAAIQPKEGYLKFLRELCDRHGIVLIFDEVKTGFRLSDGGAQKVFGVKPHIATFAKSLGNGYPISAIAGTKEIMQKIGKNRVFHGGTYAGHPLSLAAADTTLDQIMQGNVHKRIDRFGGALMRGISQVFEDRKIDGLVQGSPGMFQFVFTKKDTVSNFRELLQCDLKLYSKLQLLLLGKGIMIDETNAEPIFTCAAHTKEDLQRTLEAIDSSIIPAKKSAMKEQKGRI